MRNVVIAERVVRISAIADETFGNPQKAYRWLGKPNRGLGGQVPLELLVTEAGTRLVEQALGRIDTGSLLDAALAARAIAAIH